MASVYLVCMCFFALTLAQIDAAVVAQDVDNESVDVTLSELKDMYHQLSTKVAHLEALDYQKKEEIASLESDVQNLRDSCGCGESSKETSSSHFELTYFLFSCLLAYVIQRLITKLTLTCSSLRLWNNLTSG